MHSAQATGCPGIRASQGAAGPAERGGWGGCPLISITGATSLKGGFDHFQVNLTNVPMNLTTFSMNLTNARLNLAILK